MPIPPRRPLRPIAWVRHLMWVAVACDAIIAFLSFAAMPRVDARLRVLDALPDDASAAHSVVMVCLITGIAAAVIFAALGLVVRRPGRSARVTGMSVAAASLAVTCSGCVLGGFFGLDGLFQNYPYTGQADGDIFAAAIPPAYAIAIAFLQAATLILAFVTLIVLCLPISTQYYRDGFAIPRLPYRGEHS